MSQSVGYTNEQMDHLGSLFKNKIDECLKTIMDSDDEFEGDRESFESLFSKLFTTEGLERVEEIKSKSKGKSKSKSKSKAKSKMSLEEDEGEELVVKRKKRVRTKTPYFVWLWDMEEGMKSIKENYPEMTHRERLSKAGEIWKSMSEKEKEKYNEIAKKYKEEQREEE